MTNVIEFLIKAKNTSSTELKKVDKDLRQIGDAAEKTATGGVAKMDKASGSLGNTLKSIATAGIGLMVAREIFDIAKASIEASSRVEEMTSKFNVVFGEAAPEATQALKEFGDQVNRSQYDLQEMAASVQDTFVPLGFARDEAAKMSVELTKLATDVASFNNKLDTDVMLDFQSAIVGNHETVRKYGIVITEARLKQEMSRLGMINLTGAALEQAKVQARLNLILSGTTDAQGDAARTSGSYANTSRGLAAAILDLKVAIGDGLIPVMLEALPIAIELFRGVSEDIVVQRMLNEAYERRIITMDELWDVQNKMGKGLMDLAEAEEFVKNKTEEHNLVVAASATHWLPAMEAAARNAISAIEDIGDTEGIDSIATAAEIAEGKVNDLNTAMQLTGTIQDATKSQRELNAELEDLQAHAERIAASGSPLGLTPYQLEELGDINQRVTDIKTKLEEEAIAHEENTKRILVSLAERKLEVGGWTDEEITFLESLMTQWGLLDEDAAVALAEMNAAIDKFNSGSGLDQLYDDLDKILQKILEINRTPIAPKVGGAPKPIIPGAGGQHGLDMIVPAGFPGDSYPIRATSGERVTITPVGGSSYNYGGDTIIINNHNAAAAVLTKAMIADRKRARLNASMGR